MSERESFQVKCLVRMETSREEGLPEVAGSKSEGWSFVMSSWKGTRNQVFDSTRSYCVKKEVEIQAVISVSRISLKITEARRMVQVCGLTRNHHGSRSTSTDHRRNCGEEIKSDDFT